MQPRDHSGICPIATRHPVMIPYYLPLTRSYGPVHYSLDLRLSKLPFEWFHSFHTTTGRNHLMRVTQSGEGHYTPIPHEA